MMTSAEFLAEGGAAKQDIKVPVFGTVKKQSSRYKAIIKALDRYHRLITKPFPHDLRGAQIALQEPYDAIKDIGTFTKAYIDEHQSEENPLTARNSVVLALWQQTLADRLIFEGFIKLISGRDRMERFDEFMTGNGSSIGIIKDLLDQAPQSGKHDDIKTYFGLK